MSKAAGHLGTDCAIPITFKTKINVTHWVSLEKKTTTKPQTTATTTKNPYTILLSETRTQLMKTLCKPDDLSLVPEATVAGQQQLPKVVPDLHMCAIVYVGPFPLSFPPRYSHNDDRKYP